LNRLLSRKDRCSIGVDAVLASHTADALVFQTDADYIALVWHNDNGK